MDSKFLIKNGFKRFGEFNYEHIKNKGSEINFSGIYAFVLDRTFSRLNGKTDILYIGQSGGRSLRGRPIIERMDDYLRAYKSAPQDKRIGDSLNKIKTKVRIGRILKNPLLNNRVYIFYKKFNPDQCKREESSLLKEYSEDHIELPPLNRQQ